MTGPFGAPPNDGQLPSYPPQLMGQAVVVSDIPMYLHRLITMDGATAPVTYFLAAGWHQGMSGHQPFTASSTLSRHLNAQMGGGYSPYNSVARATVAPNIQTYAGASMPVYGVNPPLAQAPIKGAFPVYEQQPLNITSAQPARREKRYDPYKLSLAPKCTETSSEPELYCCQWGDCLEGPMTETKIFEHF